MYLSEKEEITLQLEQIHNHTEREDEKHRAEIKADVQVRWPHTLNLLISKGAYAS
jgi:hypothetical protein